jgi:hypothetical protein
MAAQGKQISELAREQVLRLMCESKRTPVLLDRLGVIAGSQSHETSISISTSTSTPPFHAANPVFSLLLTVLVSQYYLADD